MWGSAGQSCCADAWPEVRGGTRHSRLREKVPRQAQPCGSRRLRQRDTWTACCPSGTGHCLIKPSLQRCEALTSSSPFY